MTDESPVSPTPDAESQSRTYPSTLPGARRILPAAIEKLTQAFDRATADGERVTWDAFLAGQPDPSRPGVVVTALAIHLRIPSTYMNQYLSATPVVDCEFAFVEQEVVDDFVRQRVDELRAARSQQVAEQQAQGNGAGSNPTPTTPGGLILPR